MEVKSGEGTVVVADRNRYSDECCNNRGWGSGWGAVGGALVGGGFGAAAVSVWDKINDTKADIQKVESTVQEAKAGIYKDISDAARGVKGLVRESENRLALQAERNHCEVMKGQQEIKCLIENTAKDQEIARLNRVVDAQRDQNIINSVVQALGNKTA
jgi:hypothetical protein|nr:MAG: hypothetical protein [Bacteriophage sp.]